MENNDRDYILALASALLKSSDNIVSKKVGNEKDASEIEELSCRLLKKYITTNPYYEDYCSLVLSHEKELSAQTKTYASTVKYNDHIEAVKKLARLERRIDNDFDYSFRNAAAVRVKLMKLEEKGRGK